MLAQCSKQRQNEGLDAMQTSREAALAQHLRHISLRGKEFLPGVSANVRMIAFREQNVNPHGYFVSTPELRARIDATKTLRTLDQTVPSEERCALLESYAIRYVVARPDQVAPFKEVIEPCQNNVTMVFSTDDLFLLEISD
jgi:hypothetical protein